jgi:prepilin-type processing-associated H-X9-DG protein
MYKIIGADQKEYGPVSADQIRQWISQGRANAQTRVAPEGSTDWKSLAEFPELAEMLAGRATPMTADSTRTAQAAAAGQPKTSGMAIWSLVLGILGFFCGLTALPGLILGFISMGKIKRSNGTLGGEGIALAGTIVSGICLALSLIMVPIMAGMLLPALAQAKSKAQTINCVNNLKQIGLAIRIYATDNKDLFPAATNWCDAILTDVGSAQVFKCPSGNMNQRCHYAFNARLANAEDGKVDPSTVLIFETDGGWNLHGGPELMLKKPRHGNAINVVLADGSVQQLSPARVSQLRWDP